MNSAIDSTGIGNQPVYNNNFWQCLFFCAFMVIGSIFMLNLFVGVIIDNFNKIKRKEEVGGIFVTESQRRWIEIQRLLINKPLLKLLAEPKNCFRKVIFRIIHN